MLFEEWPEGMSIDDKIKKLLEHFKVTEHVEIEEDAKELILGALNRNDVMSVYTDDEGGINIEYYGGD